MQAEFKFGELIRQARKERGWTLEKLAKQAGIDRWQTVQKIENGTTKKGSYLPQILAVLDLPLTPLIVKTVTKQLVAEKNTGYTFIGPEDLGIYEAQEDLEWGEFVLTARPAVLVSRPEPLLSVKDGYGILIADSSMAPEYEVGNIALVHPHLPPAVGSTCVFYRKTPRGEIATIRRLTQITSAAWHVRQWTPKEGEPGESVLPRSVWKVCHMTVGRYTSR